MQVVNAADVTIFSPLEGQTYSQPAPLSVSAKISGKREYSLDDSPNWTELTIPGEHDGYDYFEWLPIDLTGAVGASAHSVSIRETRDGATVPSDPITIHFLVKDATAPSLTISEPIDGDEVQILDGAVTGQIAVRGAASDNELGSGVASVEVALDGGDWTEATTLAGNWSAWECIVKNVSAGSHKINIRATDKSGNSTRADRTVTVNPFGLDPGAYLRDLLAYATRRLRRGDGHLATVADLEGLFHQQFTSFAVPLGASEFQRPRSALRLACQVLAADLDTVVPVATAHWPLTGATTNALGQDLSGNQLQLQSAGGVVPAQDSGHGHVASFDGTASLFVTPVRSDPADDPLFLSAAFTIGLWLKPSILPANGMTVLSRLGNYTLTLQGDGSIAMEFGASAAADKITSSPGTISANTWTYVAVVYQPSLLKVRAKFGLGDISGAYRTLYVNGVAKNGELKGRIDPSASGREAIQFNLGGASATPGVGGFQGEISDVRVHSWGLTQAEVVTIMNSRLSQAPDVALTAAPLPPAQVDNPQNWMWSLDTDAPGGAKLDTLAAVMGDTSYTVTWPDAGQPVAAGDLLYAWVFLDPAAPPSSIAIGWRDESPDDAVAWHTATWTYAQDGANTISNSGQWTWLSIAAADVGLTGSLLRGLRLTATNGQASYAQIGKRNWRAAATSQLRDCLLGMYESLLGSSGTSFTELRLMRTNSDPTARQALATRLGIDLADQSAAHLRPDRLDALLLTPASADPDHDPQALTESSLTRLFGLPSLLTPAPRASESGLDAPLLSTWRRERLHREWIATDTAQVVVDPDVVGEADLLTASPGDPAYVLWLTRERWLQAQYTAISGRLTATRSADDLVTLINQTAGDSETNDLLELDNQRRAGHSIDAAIDTLQLTAVQFNQLVQVMRLARQPDVDVLSEELLDVAAILTNQAKLRSAFPSWLAEEQSFAQLHGPLLSTAWFNYPDASNPSLPATIWSTTAFPRQSWERTLQTRYQQEATLAAELEAAQLQADNDGLPVLRDFLISTILRGTPTDTELALSRRLLIDLRPTASTTAIQLATETLQSIISAARDRELTVVPHQHRYFLWDEPTEWTTSLAQETFDSEWMWMGRYSSWLTAQWIFLYPDTLLLPSLLGERSTAEFKSLITNLPSSSPLTPGDAATHAEAYRKDVMNEIDAAKRGDTGQENWLSLSPESADPRNVSTLWFADSSMNAETNLWGSGEPAKLITSPAQLELLYYAPIQIGRTLQQSGYHREALRWYRRIYNYADPNPDRRPVGSWIAQPATSTYNHTDDWLQSGLDAHALAATRSKAHLRYILTCIAQCLIEYADSEFASATVESIAHARQLYTDAFEVLDQLTDARDTHPDAPPDITSPPLRQLALAHVTRLRNGHDLSGIPLPAESSPAAVSSLAVVANQPAPGSAASPINLAALGDASPNATTTQPGPYRYSTLITRSQQLIAATGPLESAYLSAMSQSDAAGYTALRAQQDLQVANAVLAVHTDQVAEAQTNAQLAKDQVARAQTQYDTYSNWLAQGENAYEKDQLASISATLSLKNNIDQLNDAFQSLQIGMSVISGAATTFGGIAVIGAAQLAALGIRGGMTRALNTLEVSAQTDALQASWQRRAQEWQLSRDLASADIMLATDQQAAAAAHLGTTQADQAVAAQLQANAQAAVNYLTNQKVPQALYDQMTLILGRSYRAMLQQATSMAQQAQSGLIFERQDPSIDFIRSDYWSGPSSPDASTLTPGNSDQPPAAKAGSDTLHGLTGTARLQTDLTRLDQYAFSTDRRKLQLSQSVSLSQASPVDFHRFRTNGILPFVTTNLFLDQGFPGHYFRIIDRIRVSVIGLIPPTTGIRATLTSSGLSRTVVKSSDNFIPVVMRRQPETIAFTSPVNASGIAFELDPQPQLLKPFEGMGVESNWLLSMPKAANPLDYSNLADIVITLDYLALDSDLYRVQVLSTTNTTKRGQLAVSLAYDMPDQFYSLINTASADHGASTTVEVLENYLPPNLNDIDVEAIAVYIVATPSLVEEITIDELTFSDGTGRTRTAGPASTMGKIASTGTTASNWAEALLSQPLNPVGTWRISINASATTALATGKITDVLLVLNYVGSTPPWPA